MKELSLFTPGTLVLFQIGKSVLVGTLFYTIQAMSQSLEIPANLGTKGCDCTGHIAANADLNLSCVSALFTFVFKPLLL